MREIAPHLETLPPAQRALWPRLSEVASELVLYSGTSLSLQAGGRTSVDFDFFSHLPLDIEELSSRYSFLYHSRLQYKALNTATFLVGGGDESVVISFFGGPKFGRVSEPNRFADNKVLAAGLYDLSAQKDESHPTARGSEGLPGYTQVTVIECLA